MTKGSGLNCLAKRDLLNQHAVSVETLLRWGGFFEESGLLHDAVDFYRKAGAHEPLKRLMGLAVDEGDLFLFKRLLKVLEVEPDVEQWRRLGESARSRGKLSFAAEALRLAGDDEGSATTTSTP
ncbi:MAG: hypothetical protein MUF52_05000 [Syntrophobacteraceae bacterium]|jgi:hypothetical protein|nr:hypothetical protein [Syntrophobacteraceae bacterium]